MISTLIIKSNNNDFERFYNKQIKECGADVLCIEDVFKGIKGIRILKRLKVFFRLLRLKNNGFFKRYNKVIVFENIMIALSLRLIMNKETKIILWMWNTISPAAEKWIKVVKRYLAIWSFDEGDCNRFGLKRNTQFYFNLPIAESIETEISSFFVGKDKGRLPLLINLKKILVSNNIITNFYVVPDTDSYSKDEGVNFIEEMEYDRVLDNLQKCTFVVDIVKKGQTGLTVRALEALHFKKYLITNNASITKEEIFDDDFIFIIGCDDQKKIKKMLNSKNKNFSKEIDYYFFENWLKRFK